MPFVIAFIAFNILDLDGSNLLSLTRSFAHSMLDADLEAFSRLEPSPERIEYHDHEQILIANYFPIRHRSHRAQSDRSLSRLERARSHLYHVSFPRDSVPG
jgi:hypothetical protein